MRAVVRLGGPSLTSGVLRHESCGCGWVGHPERAWCYHMSSLCASPGLAAATSESGTLPRRIGRLPLPHQWCGTLVELESLERLKRLRGRSWVGGAAS